MSKGFSVRFRKGTETKISGAKITGTVLTTIGLIIRAITVGLGIVPTTTAGPFTLSAVRDIGSEVAETILGCRFLQCARALPSLTVSLYFSSSFRSFLFTKELNYAKNETLR